MTATERLRALLDEREMDWEAWNDRITVALPDTHYLEITDGSLCVVIVDLTPEQAVEATLGRGTCKAMKVPLEWDESWNDMFEGAGHVEIFRWVCSHCGRVLDGGSEYVERDTFCPKCGRQIEWGVES